MGRSAAQREAARRWQRNKRDRARQSASAAAAARAVATDEQLASSVLRDAIMTAVVRMPPEIVRDAKGKVIFKDGIAVQRPGKVWEEAKMLVGPRIRIIGGKPARSNALEMEIGLRNRDFTDSMKRAVEKLRLDWNDVGCGVNVAAVDYLRVGHSKGDGGHQALKKQLDARQRLEGVMAFLGAFTPVVCRVVLDNIPIGLWVLELDSVPTMREGVELVLLALGRLVLFYDPPSPDTRVRIRTIGPERGDYSTEMEVGDERV